MKRLNVGSGLNYKEGYLNIDKLDLPNVDSIVDVSQIPWPFSDDEFDEILVEKTLEHLEDQPSFFEEAFRVLKPDGVLKILGAHFSSVCVFQDPTPKRGLSYFMFRFYDKAHKDKEHPHYNFKCNFKPVSRRFVFPSYLKWFQPIANKFPGWYEANMAFMFRATYLDVVLRAVK